MGGRSFDDLICLREECWRNGQTEFVRGLEVEDETKERRLFERQFRRFGSFKNSIHEGSNAVEAFVHIRTV
jgi:hypothetical protein